MKPIDFSLAFTLLVFVACSESNIVTEDHKPIKLGSIARAESGETITFEEGFSVEVMSISDSRCPTGAVCIWQGDAIVDFRVGLQKETLSLCLLQSTPDCKGEGHFMVVRKTYTIILLDVRPYPGTSNTNQNIVEFLVKY